jgi:hypothetical protein
MIKRWPIFPLCGILAVLVYVVLSLVAYRHYPGSYSPMTKSLSDLGDPTQNPSGAIFYNSGGILLGLLLVPFYLGMKLWNTGEKRLKILIAGGQAGGLISSAGLVLSFILLQSKNFAAHGIWAGEAFFFSLFFWIFSAFAMLRNPQAVKWVAYFGWLPLVLNIVLFSILGISFLSEWFSVGLFLVYVLLLSYNTRVMASRHTMNYELPI